ncbi:PREDICTED: nuclear pore-associated protein 1-like [Hipposideros armiger]|uniref:Nuclear pore-associated protein 1-like n=1 Tax=Hipposideros armiger TaxID=186990 RepID=A0A8B7PZ74_HIPAR|nr:PREDICTED: nuclear pore-associated protein 1-like [Hipposideros armiger]XP_019481466.1 PREDICTED: nuclear pore-associated protein 1-like [Hipposideros armiger]
MGNFLSNVLLLFHRLFRRLPVPEGRRRTLPGGRRRAFPAGHRTSSGFWRTLPDDVRTFPGDARSLPGDSCTRPGDPRSLPGDPCSLPGDPRSLPGDPRTFPGGGRSFPGDGRSLPGTGRHFPGGGRPVICPVRSNYGPPDRKQPAAPAQVLHPGRSPPDCVWIRAAILHLPRRQVHVFPPGMYSSVGSLRARENWSDPRKKPVRLLSSLFVPSGTTRIPPAVRNFVHPWFAPKQVVQGRLQGLTSIILHPGPSGTTRIPLPVRNFVHPWFALEQIVQRRLQGLTSTVLQPDSKDIRVKIQKTPKKVLANREQDHVKTKGQDDQNNHHSNGDLPKTTGAAISDKGSPEPADSGPKHPECSLSENSLEAPMSSPAESQVAARSGSPAGDALPPPKPDSESAGLSAPTPCCSVLPERATEEVPGEDHAQIYPDSHKPGKEMPSNKPADIPPVSSSLVSASRGRGKRKIAKPPSPPLPPLMEGQGQLPALYKHPCLASDPNHETSKNPTCQWNKTMEDKTKVKVDSSATQSAPSFTPAGVAADSLPPAPHSAQVPATANSADPSARPPTLPVPTPPPLQNIDQKKGHIVPRFSLRQCPHSMPPLRSNHMLAISPSLNGGRLRSVLTTSPVSHVSTPAVTSTVSTASANKTGERTASPDVVDMDTTLPLDVVLFRAPP